MNINEKKCDRVFNYGSDEYSNVLTLKEKRYRLFECYYNSTIDKGPIYDAYKHTHVNCITEKY